MDEGKDCLGCHGNRKGIFMNAGFDNQKTPGDKWTGDS
jgi:hypothetical protein